MKVISAGLPRSGSTLLFNILREFLGFAYGDRLVSFWCESLPESIPPDAVLLIKTHRLVREYRKGVSNIFFTYRDIRNIAVSAYRIFDYPICMRTVRSYVREFHVAKKSGALMIRYEELIENSILVTARIGEKLELETDFEVLYQSAVEAMKTVGDITQVHPYHITNTQDGEWRTIIPFKLQREIVGEFGWWFKELGYPL